MHQPREEYHVNQTPGAPKPERRSVRRRALVALAFAAAATVGLAGCTGGSVSGNSAGGSGKTTILVWHNSSGGELKVLNKLVDRFNSSQSKYTIQPQFDAEGDTFTSK